MEQINQKGLLATETEEADQGIFGVNGGDQRGLFAVEDAAQGASQQEPTQIGK